MISFFKHNTNIGFVANRYKAYGLSLVIFAVAIVSVIWHGGLKMGVDFTGGTMLQVHFDQPIGTDEVRKALADVNMGSAEIQKLKDTERIKNAFLIRTGLKESMAIVDTSGPQVLRIETAPNPTAGATQIVVRALVSDAGRGEAKIDSVWCCVDNLANKTLMPPEPNKPEGSNWLMLPADKMKAGSQHVLQIYGRDANGNWGQPHQVTLFVTGAGQATLTPDQKARTQFKEAVEPMRGGVVANAIVRVLTARDPGNKITIDSDDTVGPKIGKELQWKAILAVLASLVLILIYVAIRFDFRFGVAAVISLFHDVLCTVGFISITNMEFNLLSVTVLLTIIGYSIMDSIVVADRIRENAKKPHKDDFATLVNRSINETLSRTVMTAMTVFLVLISLQLFASRVLQDFTKPMLFGLITGTYSSIFVVAALVVDWEIRSPSAKRK